MKGPRVKCVCDQCGADVKQAQGVLELFLERHDELARLRAEAVVHQSVREERDYLRRLVDTMASQHGSARAIADAIHRLALTGVRTDQ